MQCDIPHTGYESPRAQQHTPFQNLGPRRLLPRAWRELTSSQVLEVRAQSLTENT